MEQSREAEWISAQQCDKGQHGDTEFFPPTSREREFGQIVTF
jgi:hypothetical protein